MADLVFKLHRYLRSLHECISGAESSLRENVGTAGDLIKTIADLCLSVPLTEKEIANVCSNIFSEEYGVLLFLKTIINIKEVKSLKLECFKLLDSLCDQIKSEIIPYGVQIKDVCISFLMRDSQADSKKAALVTLSKILEICQGTCESTRMEIKTLTKNLILQLSQSSKLGSTVKEEILCLLGVIAHFYPQDFLPDSERVLAKFLRELKQQVNAKTKKLDQNIVSGCLLGLKEYLYNFTVSYTEDAEKSYQIFKFARNVIEARFSQESRYSMSKAGLLLFAAHAPQFAEFCYEDYNSLYKDMIFWARHNNRDMQKAGFAAVDAFLKQVSEILALKIAEKKDLDKARMVFNFFLSEFKRTFQYSESPRNLSIAVTGYGLFAAPCKLYLTEQDVKRMLIDMIQRCEQICFNESTLIEERIIYLPAYIEAMASISSEIENIPESLLFTMEKLLVFQIKNFPYFPSTHHFLSSRSVLKLFLSLQPKGAVFKGFVSRTVYQSLARTCSHSVVADVDAVKDKNYRENQHPQKDILQINPRLITYKNYIKLWKSILDVVQLKELSTIGIPLADRHALKEAIYDELIRAILHLVSKLDLTVDKSLSIKNEPSSENVSSDNIEPSSNPVHGLHPNNLKDFHIFINLVDFARDMLTDKCTDLFHKWVYIFGKEMIQYATKYPCISGFYKLVALNLKICSKIQYFKNMSPEDIKLFAKVTENQLSKEHVASFHLFSKFSREVVVRLQQYKDDLLASCLQVLLELPIEIVQSEIHVLIPSLQSTFKLGLSYLPLARFGLNALENWCTELPLDVIEPYFPLILPYLNSYLTASRLEAEKTPIVNTSITKAAAKKGHKISAKYVKLPQKNISTELAQESELSKFQLQIIQFLGSLGGQYNRALLEHSYKKIEETAIAWDSMNRNHLIFPVPFTDMKPEVCFDDFLPRVLELATKASDRQIKVAACEVLHSLVLYTVGRGSQMPESHQKKSPMDKLYKHLFPGLLELACDVEQVSKQLFQPLVFQLIHWFSNSKIVGSPESSIILLSLWEGVTHQHDAALRDFSALCLKEFVLWSIKQSSSKGLEKTPTHIKDVFKMLFSYSHHPNPFKRLGAALTFNNIYSIFRDEEILVKMYTLELLVHFVNSLAVAHNDDKSLGTQEQCKDALNHIGRILKVKYKVFLKAHKHAKKPLCFGEATLTSAVKWLLQQCGRPQTECRHKCMQLVINLAPLLPGVRDAADYFCQVHKMGGKIAFIDIFECKLKQLGPLPAVASQISLKAPILWLESLLSCLECYNWVFSQNLLQQNMFNDEEGIGNAHVKSNVFGATEFFIKCIAKKNLSSVLGIFCHLNENEDLTFSPKEIYEYNWMKCTVLVRLLNFFVIVIESEPNDLSKQLYQYLWNSEFWELILISVIDPAYLGFDMTDDVVLKNLPLETTRVIKTCMSKSHLAEFAKYCNNYLASSKMQNIMCLLPVDLKNINDDQMYLLELLKGYEQLITIGIWPDESYQKSSKLKFIMTLLDCVSSGCTISEGSVHKKANMNPLSVQLAKQILAIAFALGCQVNCLMPKILDPLPIMTTNHRQETKKGMVVLNYFEEEISAYAASISGTFIPALVEHMKDNAFDVMFILHRILFNVSFTRELRKQYGKPIIETVISCWNKLSSWWEGPSGLDNLYTILSLMTDMLLIDSKVAVNSAGEYSLSLFPSYIMLLRKPDAALEFKVLVLDLLPFFVAVSGENLQLLRSSLEEIIVTYFPTQSTELHVGSSQYNSYISAIQKLLSALKLTGNEILLELLIVIFCKEDNHVMEEEFQKCIAHLIKRMPANTHQRLAEVPFHLTKLENKQLSPDVKFAVLDRACLCILRTIALSAFINFYVANIKLIMGIIKERMIMYSGERKAQLVGKIGAFKLMDLLYSRLPKEQLHSTESQIVTAYFGCKPETGKELTTDITKFALDFKREDLSRETTFYELCRKLCCASFNTLIAVVSCTQTELKFYNTFIFRENAAKGEYIWENIVDIKKEYNFSIELDVPLIRKKKFVFIRHNVRQANDANVMDVDYNIEDIDSSLKFMASENLHLSSLAEDVGQFDFSTSEQVFSNKKEKKSLFHENVSKSNPEKDNNEGHYIEIEADELNQHECTAAVICLLKHMAQSGIIPKGKEEELPIWLETIVKKLEDTNCHKNIKLFLTRIMINNDVILEPFARYLLKPLMQLILTGVLGSDMNYYILDVIVMILSWAPTVIPEDTAIQRHAASTIVEFLMKKCGHSRQDIFRNNLEVIKTVLECWKDRIEIPYRQIYDAMNNSDPESKSNVVGIQLLGLILSCNLPPYPVGQEAEGYSYLNILARNINHKHKEVYASAAEVVGLVLKHIQGRKSTLTDDPFCIKIKSQVDKMSNEKNRFLLCLNKIHLYYPQIADSCLHKLLYMQCSIHGIYQIYILEILYSRVNDMEDGYHQLKAVKLFEKIEHKEESVQLLLLKILEKVFPVLSCDEKLYLLPIIIEIHSQPSIQCRDILYKILMLQYDTYRGNDGAKEKEVTRLAQETLLKGLADPDLPLRLIVDNFWSNETRLPVNTKDRLLALIQNMYSPPTEAYFLQYATFLLLERTSHSPDYKRKIFEHPLSQCNFQVYNISTSWRQRHAGMSPMFAESMSADFSSSLLNTLDEQPSHTSNEGKIRATQQHRDFSATHDMPERTPTFNWLTERSIDTYGDWGSLGDRSLDTLSSFTSKSHLFTLGRGENRKDPKTISVYKSTNIIQKVKNVKEKEEKTQMYHLKRRFVKDKSQSNVFSKIEVRRKDVREEMRKEQQIRREAQVTMYRQYRIGDLPDIQISNSAIIAPLQALAQNDATIAKMLLKSLVIAISEAVETDIPQEYHAFSVQIGECLKKILNNSSEYVPAVISFCLEAIFHLKTAVKFDPEIIVTASKKSNQQSIGILLLEAKLLEGFDAQPQRKKIKQEKRLIEEEITHWIKLAELYRSLDDYDVVNGIFSHIMENQEIKEALELEARGDYFEAVRIYEKLYDSASEENDQAEKDFCDNAVLFCYDKLTQWDTVEKAAVSRFTNSEEPDLQKVWEEPHFQNYYLPYIMRSKIKLLLEERHDQSLLSFIDESMKNEDYKLILETHFAEEQALLHVIQENFDGARHYSFFCLQKFLKEWKGLSSLAVGVQQSKLQNLQKFTELQEFLNLMKKEENCVNLSYTKKLMKLWQKRLPSIMDPVNIWDDVNANRHLYLKKLQEKISVHSQQSANDSETRYSNFDLSLDSSQIENENVEKFFLESKVSLSLPFIKTATLQGNIPVSLTHLKKINKITKKLDETHRSMFIEAYCNTYNSRALKFSGEQKLEPLLSSLDQLVKLDRKSGLSSSQKMLQSHALEMIAESVITGAVNVSELREEIKSKILEAAGGGQVSLVAQNLLENSYGLLRNSASSAEAEYANKQKMSKSRNTVSMAYMTLANFCNRYLRQHEAEESTICVHKQITSFAEYPKVFVESLLSSMHGGSLPAVQLFPRLLQVIELYPISLPVFIEKTLNIPCWMFIGWISQMIVLLDKPAASAVHRIIENIALEYPNSLVYAFRLSRESYNFPTTSEGKKHKTFVERIKVILDKLPLIEDFIEALDDLGVPHVLFKTYFDNIFHLLRKQRSSKESKEHNEKEVLKEFNKVWTNLFAINEKGNVRKVPVGPLRLDFAKKFSKSVADMCGKDGKLLLTTNPKKLSAEYSCLLKTMKNTNLKAGSYKLKDISLWLSEFQPWKYNNYIEIPGQYSGKSKPLPEYHVQIAGFDEKVLVLTSITFPRRIIIRGDDEKEYKFLVKAGEDLRQDSRIQQLFSVMNDIYSKDPDCGRRRIQLQTYKVIPLSSKIGVIEWVDNTTVLGGFMKSVMTDKELKTYESGHLKPEEKVCKWIGGLDVPSYIRAHETKNRTETVNKFEEIVNIVPKWLLKKSFLKLSSSSEAFLRLRSHFAISHAVICISQWILGIGDRHLGNFLINLSTGGEIGIDFGHAFGSATQFLPIPELMPFRLTPQYLQLMMPLKEKGLFQATMIHTLNALRRNHDLLMNIMDIFIKEPTVDWQVNAVKQQQALGMSEEETKENSWYPKQRVQIACKKLEGANPCHVTREELKLGHGKKPVYKKIEAVCLGEPKYNVRATLSAENLTVEQQVACLIDQATDPNILGKTYCGWSPWM